MVPIFKVYILVWASALVVAIAMLFKNPDSFAIGKKSYWTFLFKPWKLCTFFLAAFGLTAMAPYTVDPTWDYVDSLFMSILTFTTAPWSVGVIYKAFKRQVPAKSVYVAVCLWLFSASWSYDLYILIRDGVYPATWLTNLGASSILYLLAGLFWNLDWTPDRGVTFSFMFGDWPASHDHPVFRKIFWLGFLFILFVLLMMVSFLQDFQG
jgi:hypothetical protein